MKTIDFLDEGERNRALRAARDSRRFRLDVPARNCANALYLLFRQEVESRGCTLRFDEATRSHIAKAAEWLTNPNGTYGLLLSGLYGNGKTSLAKSIARLIEKYTEREAGYSMRKVVKLYTAKQICRICVSAGDRTKDSTDRYERLFTEPMILIDDLGEEPREIMLFGMIHTPIVDIISERYAAQRLTILTTNLNVDELREKYGERILDRFREMLTPIVFENESYRTGKADNPMGYPY
ncbi:MAG: replication protein [Bacteroidales bacterium]|nr:replication protein [Bacteroidales bacterium]